jgi:hypothetical protein
MNDPAYGRLPGSMMSTLTYWMSPGGAFAVILAERTVLILDGATGKERARLTDFVNPMRIEFAKAAAPTVPATP